VEVGLFLDWDELFFHHLAAAFRKRILVVFQALLELLKFDWVIDLCFLDGVEARLLVELLQVVVDLLDVCNRQLGMFILVRLGGKRGVVESKRFFWRRSHRLLFVWVVLDGRLLLFNRQLLNLLNLKVLLGLLLYGRFSIMSWDRLVSNFWQLLKDSIFSKGILLMLHLRDEVFGLDVRLQVYIRFLLS